MQGKLVEDFASLLKSLWSQEYLCIFPSKFKRGLIKYKPQFAGNEQQDSQVLLYYCMILLFPLFTYIVSFSHFATFNTAYLSTYMTSGVYVSGGWLDL